MASKIVEELEEGLVKLKAKIKATEATVPSPAPNSRTPQASINVQASAIRQPIAGPSGRSSVNNVQNICTSNNVLQRLSSQYKGSQYRCKPLKRKANVEFLIDKIILLDDARQEKTLTKSQMKGHRNAKLIRDLISFDSGLTWDDIVKKMKSLFTPHLDTIQFKILKVESNNLIEPHFDEGVTLNGEMLQRLFYRKIMYVKPEETLHIVSPKDVCSNRITSYFEESEEEDEIGIEAKPDTAESDIEMYDVESTSNTEKDVKIIEDSDETNIISFQDVLKFLRSQLSFPEIEFIINRTSVFEDVKRHVKRNSFDLSKYIRVVFTDTLGIEDETVESFKEEAEDLGGPSREMFTLCLRDIQQSKMFFGEASKYLNFSSVFSYSTDGKENDYVIAGIVIAMSFLHGGPGPNFFSEDVFNDIIQGEITEPKILRIADGNVRHAIEEIQNAHTVEALREALLSPDLHEAQLASYAASLDEKKTIVNQALHYFAVSKIKPVLDDLCKGLEKFGFLDILRSNPNLFKEHFLPVTKEMTPKDFFAIFKIVRSTVGSNRFNVESMVLSFFSSFLHDCEEGTATTEESPESVTISDILFFATGSDRIPPGGFSIKPQIHFSHNEPGETPKPYPLANTCIISLYLPTMHTKSEKFREKALYAFKNVRGFGFC